MNLTVVQWEHSPDARLLITHRVLVCLILLIGCSVAAVGQTSQQTNLTPPFSARVTHLLGFEGVKNNASGTLSMQGSALQFQTGDKPAVQLQIASVQDVSLGEQSKQVGGLPMTLGKAAAPYGGGRVVSLFAHKKYDTLSLEYVDSSGGVHGAIFQLSKGQGEVLRNELVARGAHVSNSEDQPRQQTTVEVSK